MIACSSETVGRTIERSMHRDEDLYQERILEYFEEPFHRGSCPAPTHIHEDENPLCGDLVRLELAVDASGVIQDAYFSGEGCCISQAAASMLVERISGKTRDEVRQFKAQEMLDLFGARLTPNRQKCCLLGWRVLQAVLYSPARV
jgi:nitrogen fixation NifU-like protein